MREPSVTYERLDRDEWFDEIVVQGVNGPLFRFVTVPRYKTSGISGDEWRTSVSIEVFEGTDEVPEGTWVSFDDGARDLDIATKAFYPKLHASGRRRHSVAVRTTFARKGRVAHEIREVGDGRLLLTTAGHLPWALIVAGEQCGGTFDGWEKQCFQPGCPDDASTVYRLRQRFTRCGEVKTDHGNYLYQRAFCSRHAHRGDCGLEDCDKNYEVISGHGPEGAKIREGDESPAVAVFVDAEGTDL